MAPEVTVIEVGPRDGLQNEQRQIPLADKVRLVEDLANAGLQVIETGSFVNPKWVPQMADSEAVFDAIQRRPQVRYTALTPNLRGYERARSVAADEVAVFAAASEDFSQKNINCSIAESLERFAPVMSQASADGVPVRGYVSCVLGCPYAGEIAPEQVLDVCRQLLALGCYEVSLGDTIGVGTPGSMRKLLDCLLAELPADRLAVHCHDTYGQALANVLVALELGISRVDASVAGLGGCPYARGASGNLATEDLVYMLQGMGITTHIDLEALIEAGCRISDALERPTGSRVARAMSGS